MDGKKPPPASDNGEGSSNLKYFLAAATFATAFGNMFAVRRLRVPKAPRGFYKEDAWKPKGPEYKARSEKYKTESDARTQQRHREYHWGKEQQRVMREAYGHMGRRRGPGSLSVPPLVAMHLKTLEMPTGVLPSREEVKQQFRTLALRYHPDRVDSSTPDAARQRREVETRFKQVSEAHKQLNIWFDQNKE